jgi:glycosyltransferase involved in cell wall biosynthesis
LKIGILQREDVTDVRHLSGIPYFMVKALREHVGEVVFLGPDRSLLTRLILKVGQEVDRLSYAIFRRHLSFDHHRILARTLARTFTPRVAVSGCDLIFAPNASLEIAYLKTDKPIFYYSDATWQNVVDYYPGYSSFFKFAETEGHRMEAMSIEKSSRLIFPSQWAADAAINFYNADPAKVLLVPCGANFEEFDIPSADLALNHPLQDEITLLWVGVDWERKRGAIAFDCLQELLRNGVKARLVICGCVPPKNYCHAAVEIVPFLRKSDPAQRKRLSQLFLDAHFFIFPTMAEAFGIVLCEASAHGLPSLVANTGGVGGAISDGENGYLLPLEAQGSEYAGKIMKIVREPEAYDRVVRTSRKHFEDKLNWDAWARAVKPVFEEICPQQRPETGKPEAQEVSS